MSRDDVSPGLVLGVKDLQTALADIVGMHALTYLLLCLSWFMAEIDPAVHANNCGK